MTYGEPLRIIRLADGEQRFKRVVTGKDEASEVDEKLSTDVEEDQKGVQGAQAKNDINFGYTGLLLEVIEDLVLAQLRVEVADMLLRCGLKVAHVVGNSLRK